ncbi:MAG: alpha/beta fold hydrolase [Longimicrobiales bacterium]
MKTVRKADLRSTLLEDLPVTERRIEVAGVPTAVLEGGSGPPVVLLHGPGESALWWMRVIPALVRDHHVVAPDLPGQGASEAGGDETYTIDGMLSWLAALIEEICESRPVVVGHVLGGAIAARFAVASPDRIDHLVLVDSLGLAPFRPSIRFAFRLLSFSLRPRKSTYLRFLPHCMYDVEELREALGRRWEPFVAYNLECARSSETQAATRALMGRVAFRTIPRDDLHALTVPTTLIWGRHDRALSLEIAEEARDRYGWPLHIIDDTRDDPKLERPEAFLRAFRSAMSGSEPRHDGQTLVRGEEARET